MPAKCAIAGTHARAIPLGLSGLPIVCLASTRKGAKLLSGKGKFMTIPQNDQFVGTV